MSRWAQKTFPEGGRRLVLARHMNNIKVDVGTTGTMLVNFNQGSYIFHQRKGSDVYHYHQNILSKSAPDPWAQEQNREALLALPEDLRERMVSSWKTVPERAGEMSDRERAREEYSDQRSQTPKRKPIGSLRYAFVDDLMHAESPRDFEVYNKG